MGAPAFVNMGGGSVGLQAGGQKTDYVLLIMNEKGLKGCSKTSSRLAAKASAAAGRLAGQLRIDECHDGRRDPDLFAQQRAFRRRSKGVVISQDHSMNQAVYQKPVGRSSAIRRCRQPDAPATLQKLGNTLAEYMP